MRKVLFIITILLSFLILADPVWATSVTGTIMQNGQPLTGYVDVSLVYPSTNGMAVNLPGSGGHQPVYNGRFPAMDIPGNDTLLPRGTYYQVTYYDAYATPLARSNYVITGATYDIGTAIPTPVTTSNINFLDLLGLRNVSIQNLTLTNSLTIGSTQISTNGVTGAPHINDFRFTSGFLSGSTTCGLQEAVNDLPATGGTVYLQAGSCTLTTGVTITKVVDVAGMGQGASTLVNGSLGSNVLTISAIGSLRDFTIVGNKGGAGVTAGTNIVIGTIGKYIISNVASTNASNYGLYLNNSVNQLSLRDSQFTGNAGGGVWFDGSPLSEQESISGCIMSNNTGNGITINGSGVATVSVTDSSFANNTQSGIAVNAGATSAHIKVYRSTFISNVIAGVYLADGYAHVIEGNQMLVGAHQQFGVDVEMPALSDVLTTQVTLRDNKTSGNSTADVFTNSAVSYVLFYPQTEVAGGSAVYTFTNPAHVHLIVPTSTPAPPSTRTCNSNGCYVALTDVTGTSTYMEWLVPGPQQSDTSGAGNAAQTLTLPFTFPTAVMGAPVCVAYTTAELSGDDTHGSMQIVKSWTTSTVTVQRYRLADHGSDPSAPICTVTGY